MKRKILFIILPLIAVISLLGACAAPAPAPSPTPAPAPAPVPAPAQPAEVIEWIAQHPNPAGTKLTNSFVRETERIKEASGGRLVIRVHGGSEVVPAGQEQDGINDGILDYCKTSTNWLKDKYVSAGLFNYVIAGLRPIEMMMWMTAGGGNELLNEMLAGQHPNTLAIPGWTGTPEIFLSTIKPLETLDDFNGIKIRTTGDDGAVLSRMGAAVVNVPPGEIYEAIQRGVIDGFQLSSPSVDLTYGMDEVAKYVYMSPVRQPCEYFTNLVNKESWAALPDDLKVICEMAAYEEAMTYLGETVLADAEALEVYKSKGITVAPIPAVFEDELRKMAKEFYDEQSAKDAFFAKVLASELAFAANYSTTYPSGL